jgi:hypothetical protein
MKKLLCASLLSIAPAMAFAACSDGAAEKIWDKTPAGYCKIFFPECAGDSLGKRLSYSRENADGAEVLCTGAKGEYDSYYKVSIADANSAFKTDFEKMGVNYTSELSQWLFENCRKYCAGGEEAADATVSQQDLKNADDAAK